MKLTREILAVGLRVKCKYEQSDVYGQLGIIRLIDGFGNFYIRWDDHLLNMNGRGINSWGQCSIFELIDHPANEKVLDQYRREQHAAKYL